MPKIFPTFQIANTVFCTSTHIFAPNFRTGMALRCMKYLLAAAFSLSILFFSNSLFSQEKQENTESATGKHEEGAFDPAELGRLSACSPPGCGTSFTGEPAGPGGEGTRSEDVRSAARRRCLCLQVPRSGQAGARTPTSGSPAVRSGCAAA